MPMLVDQPMMGLDQLLAVSDILGKYQVPIIMDVDLVHLHPAMPIITGSLGRVQVRDNIISICMECR